MMMSKLTKNMVTSSALPAISLGVAILREIFACMTATEEGDHDGNTLYSDFKVLTNMYVKKLWQTEWERYPGNKLYKIQPKVDDPIPSHGRCRREETVLCRQHIGHTFLTHFYLLKGEEPPVCIPCDRLCSVEHLLTGCVDLIDWRRQFFKTESLSVLFRDCSPNSIIQFLKCTNLFNKL